MCGIFGAVGYPRNQALEACARRLGHRGPDDFGSYVDPAAGVYLAHCRLAVIDTSSGGHQPMGNEAGTVWLTFNGEIYNFRELRARLERSGHRFSSATDSEVILHGYEEWGERCIEELRGMFAFGLWDQSRRLLLLARDRLGIKPLYYCTGDGGRFAFASEPRALIGLPGFRRTLCPAALHSFLTTRYVQGESSIYEGIRRLAPGSWLRLETGSRTMRLGRYWSPERNVKPRTDKEVDERFRTLMGDIVDRHRVSDVPVGVFLSGGIDSATVASFAAGPGRSFHSFCARFEGWDRDEGPAARESAGILGTDHHELQVRVEDGASLQDVLHGFDEPLGDTSIFPTYWICREARRHVTVALSGDGGDELFGGYDWYGNLARRNWRKRLAFFMGPWVRAARLAETAWGRRCDELQHYLLINSPGFRTGEIKALFPDVAKALAGVADTEVFRRCDTSGERGWKRWQWIDLQSFLVDNNLAKIDRASMAHALEVRVPFLDHELVEFALSLTDDQCLGASGSKMVLRRYVADRGLGHLLNRPKFGFSFPVTAYWPTAAMRATVSDGNLVRTGVLSRAALDALLPPGSRATDYPYRIWLLAVLETWFTRWMLDEPARL